MLTPGQLCTPTVTGHSKLQADTLRDMLVNSVLLTLPWVAATTPWACPAHKPPAPAVKCGT